MKRKELIAILALLKFLVLIAIFLSASNANAFTSLSPVAGNQVQENLLVSICGINEQTDEQTNGEPTKQMDLDAELPNILSSK
jgi:hypothetical protein